MIVILHVEIKHKILKMWLGVSQHILKEDLVLKIAYIAYMLYKFAYSILENAKCQELWIERVKREICLRLGIILCHVIRIVFSEEEVKKG